jgi:hypothetical protein
MNKLIIGMAVVLLSACSSMGKPMSQLQQIEVGCAAAGSALKTLVEVHEIRPLSSDQVNQVKKAVAVVNPVCSSPTPPSLNMVEMSIFLAAVDMLKGAAKP